MMREIRSEIRKLFTGSVPATDGALALNGQSPHVETNPAEELAEARRELHAALEDEERSRAAHQEAQATLERTRQKIDAAKPAQRAAKEAAAAAADVTRRWALAGARGAVPPEDQALLDAAEAAQREATRAELQAAGAEAALNELNAAETNARFEADSAASKVKSARTDVLVAASRAVTLELERLQREYLPHFLELAGLALFLHQRYGEMHPYRAHVSGDAIGRVREALHALSVPTPDLFNDPVVLEHANHWQQRAAQLAADPDAPLEAN